MDKSVRNRTKPIMAVALTLAIGVAIGTTGVCLAKQALEVA